MFTREQIEVGVNTSGNSNDDPYVRLKPSQAKHPGCLYCGSGNVWWECNCFRALEVRAGKRPKPRILWRGGRMVIVLDEEAAAHNALKFERYKPVVEVASEPEAVHTDVVNSVVVNTADRKEYRREWMKKKREADRLAREHGGERKTDV